ncbi:hypothetical protein [Senegalia massiliensis]|uniref:Helix-turn-helix type 11 domain-containing protein n=1 Tax=Senegalia massiliensis TaxID=1720316 RepID=A0A845R279_9CLOT|nr:hypothetical protein [Senegalia massiliensis]NBI07532.1 hypothetical protein [Senegalia massiliensis]
MYKELTIDDDRINEYIEHQLRFLKKVYTFLDNNNFNESCLELRPISRLKNKYFRSLNLWRFDDKAINKYRDYIKTINGTPTCIYYSGYSLNYEKVVLKENGKAYEKGKINKENSMITQILPMDFDDLSLEEFEKEISRLTNLGIETINIFSGNGFQSIVLLNRPSNDKDLYRKFTHLLLDKGFNVDPKITDCSRILRMPYTFNCKEYDYKKYSIENPTGKATTIYQDTDKRYNVKDIFEKIASLPNSNTYKDALGTNNSHNKPIEMINKSNTPSTSSKPIKTKNNDFIEFKNINEMYPIIDYYSLPNAIQNVLIETPKNYRNSVLLFIVPFFRNKIGLDLDSIVEIMKVWNLNCKPSQDENFVISEVKRVFSYGYKGVGKWSTELATKFGYIEFEEYKLADHIIIPNVLFENYNNLHQTAIKIFFMMKLFEDREDIKEWDIELIAKVSKVSEWTVRRYIKQLIDFKLVDKKRGNKKLKLKNKYYISIFWDKKLGFTTINPYTIQSMIYSELDKLNDNEIKVYTYIYYKLRGNNNNKYFASQKVIGDMINMDRSTVSDITKRLHKKRRIIKKTYKNNNIPHTNYFLRG